MIDFFTANTGSLDLTNNMGRPDMKNNKGRMLDLVVGCRGLLH